MSDTMVMIAYVGKKPAETDHLYGTGITWIGEGDVHPVPVAAWERMKIHADVWQVAPAAQVESDSTQGLEELPVDIAYALSPEHSAALRREEAEQAAATEPVGKTEALMAERLARMTDEEVRAYVKAACDSSLHHALKGDNLRARALEALKG